jgi:hypothetical protein
MAQPGNKTTGWSYYPLHTIPRPLDIVWCRFPQYGMSTTKPGPKPRPGLVRAVLLNREHTKAAIEVCYGTSQLKKDRFPLDLFIENAAQLNLLGLPQATRFEIDRTLQLPWAKEFFEPRDGAKTPIIGRLTQDEVAQLETLKRIRKARRGKGPSG